MSVRVGVKWKVMEKLTHNLGNVVVNLLYNVTLFQLFHYELVELSQSVSQSKYYKKDHF